MTTVFLSMSLSIQRVQPILRWILPFSPRNTNAAQLVQSTPSCRNISPVASTSTSTSTSTVEPISSQRIRKFSTMQPEYTKIQQPPISAPPQTLTISAMDAEALKMSLNERMAEIQRQLSTRKNFIFLTGAGISTDSGIPDYRSHNRVHNPITHQAFMSSPTVRQRYWARSMIGYMRMISAKPNASHVLLAKFLQSMDSSMSGTIITQNVDNLHEKATLDVRNIPYAEKLSRSSVHYTSDDEFSNISHLHGNIHQVRCMQCDQISSREELQFRLEEENPIFVNHLKEITSKLTSSDKFRRQPPSHSNAPQFDLSSSASSIAKMSPLLLLHSHDEDPPLTQEEKETDRSRLLSLKPDGDVEIQNEYYYSTIKIPECLSCGGILKPNVVFFGANVPKDVVNKVDEVIQKCDNIVVIGTSLAVWSAYRLVRQTMLRNIASFSHAATQLQLNGMPVLPYSHSHLPSQSMLTFPELLQSPAFITIVNDGPTRADVILPAETKLVGRAAQILPQILPS